MLKMMAQTMMKIRPSEKKCFKCGEVKSLESFYKHSRMVDGHLNKCKDCTKLDTKTNRKTKSEYYTAYDRVRNSLPHRKERKSEYNKRPDVRERRKKIPYNQVRKDACTAISNALRDGIIVKQPCFICGNNDVQGHHPDYSMPLDVVWLCVPHHAEIHREYNREEDLALLEKYRNK